MKQGILMLLSSKSNYCAYSLIAFFCAFLSFSSISNALSQEDNSNSQETSAPVPTQDSVEEVLGSEAQSEENEEIVNESEVSESEATESEATESEATESEATESEATESEATESEATESEATESEASESEFVMTKEVVKQTKASLKKVLADDQLHRTQIQAIKDEASDEADLQSKQEQIDYLWHQQQILDNKNQAIVMTILDQQGWPKREDYHGSEVAQTLFLVVQHADIAFQERYFPMMQKATERGDIPPGAFAQLHDNILVSKGLRQRYGTQIKVNPKTNVPYIYPIEDEKNVDIRRAAVGLNPIAEYAKLYKVEYEGPSDQDTENDSTEDFSQDSGKQEKP